MRIVNIIIIILITTFVGYFIGKWIAILLHISLPKIFIIDPNFLQALFLRKPSMTSEILGYIIYATTALVMFILSTFLQNIFQTDKENEIGSDTIIEKNDSRL
tara:strand:- start:245 stop:553 length:309 start_codon:yes stop_codon:yes gene_type:complete